MLDIDYKADYKDLIAGDNSAVNRGYNLTQTQVASLYYEPDFGVDLERFISSKYELSSATFTAYLTQQLVLNGITPTEIQEINNKFELNLTFAVNDDKNTGEQQNEF